MASFASNKGEGSSNDEQCDSPTQAQCEALLKEEELAHIFNQLGYDKFGEYNPDKPKNESEQKHNSLHDMLVTMGISSHKELYRGIGVLKFISQEKWSDTVPSLAASIDIVTAAYFMLHNENEDKVKILDATPFDIKQGLKFFQGGESSSSFRIMDLPDFKITGNHLDWFLLKDSAEAVLRKCGLHAVIADKAYAVFHPTQNAAVDGLLVEAILRDTRYTNHIALSDNNLQGDGHERWNRLLELNEPMNETLNNLEAEMRGLVLEHIDDFDEFSAMFMQCKSRLDYMNSKGKPTNLKNTSEFESVYWKLKYLKKIGSSELLPMAAMLRDNKDAGLMKTYGVLRNFVLSEKVKRNDAFNRSGQKQNFPGNKKRNRHKR